MHCKTFAVLSCLPTKTQLVKLGQYLMFAMQHNIYASAGVDVINQTTAVGLIRCK